MTPDMMCITDLDGRKLAGRSRSLVRDADAPRGLPAAARRAGGRARASADRDRVRRRRHSARSRRARRSGDDARQHSDRGVRDAVDEGAARGGPQVHQGARRHAAGQPRRADASATICSPRTTRWRRSSTSRRSASWRGCSAASACCRAGGGAAAGAAGQLRHHGAGADLRRADAAGSGASARWSRLRSCPGGSSSSADAAGGGPASAAARADARWDGRGNSANIPRTHGTDRRRGQELAIAQQSRSRLMAAA